MFLGCLAYVADRYITLRQTLSTLVWKYCPMLPVIFKLPCLSFVTVTSPPALCASSNTTMLSVAMVLINFHLLFTFSLLLVDSCEYVQHTKSQSSGTASSVMAFS